MKKMDSVTINLTESDIRSLEQMMRIPPSTAQMLLEAVGYQLHADDDRPVMISQQQGALLYMLAGLGLRVCGAYGKEAYVDKDPALTMLYDAIMKAKERREDQGS